MSKHKKSARKQARNFGDVTINDFANSTVPTNRIKKASGNVSKVLVEDKPWDHNDYNEEFDFVKEEQEDGTSKYVLKKVAKRCDLLERVDSSVGNDYPVDIWFLISEYIRPEDVGTFSAICKTSYAVANTAKFWIHLYKQYYANVPNLPERLRPRCIFRLFGMKTSVIRSLYYMYQPFINRLSVIQSDEHPDVLAKRLCVLMWHRKHKMHWFYYFKMKEVNILATRKAEKPPDLLQMLEDVSANGEENCRVLQITCPNFIPVPPVQGLYLTSAGVTLSQGFRHHRISMIFGTSMCYSKQTLDGSNGVSILLDRAVSVKIIDWWHPLYPHSNTMEFVLNQE